MGDANPSVLIIDDDPEFRDSVARLLRSVGLHTQQFSSVSDFFNAPPPDGPTCLVLDIRMPGRSGLELQRDLAAANRQVPIIFITAHGDIPMTVQAMKGGAIESSQNRSEIRIFSRLSRPASLAIVPVARAIGPWMSSGSVSTRSAHASGKS
jgi:DNA-binding NtrC family response regulator